MLLAIMFTISFRELSHENEIYATSHREKKWNTYMMFGFETSLQ